jgi:hypothetical protein
MPSAATLFLGIVFSALGAAYVVYGKRQARFVPLLCGIALCAYTWFLDSWVWISVIGAALAILPFLFDA